MQLKNRLGEGQIDYICPTITIPFDPAIFGENFCTFLQLSKNIIDNYLIDKIPQQSIYSLAISAIYEQQIKANDKKIDGVYPKIIALSKQ